MKQFTNFFFPLLLLVLAVGWYFHWQYAKTAFKEIVDEKEKMLLLKHEFASAYLESFVPDIYYLATARNLAESLNDPNLKKELVRNYEFFTQTNRKYRMIRIIDTTGKEVVKIIYQGDTASIAPDSSLQSKKDRYFFKDAIKMQKNEIYISRLDFRVDSVKANIPGNPTIRTAIAIFDKAEKKRGFILINYRVKNFLDELDKYYASSDSDFMLLNNEGYWLETEGKQPTLGYMFADKQKETFANYHPDAWQKMQQKNYGYFQDKDGLYVFRKVDVYQGVSKFNQRFNTTLSPFEERNWVLVSYLNNNLLTTQLHKTDRTIFALMLMAIIFIAAVSYALAGNKAKEEASNNAIKEMNKKLLQHETVLKKQNEELTSKNRELEQYTYIASHDLQEPVKTLNSFVGLLRDDYKGKLDKEADVYLNFISQATNRMQNLVKGLLDFSRIGKDRKLTLVDCNEIIKEVLIDLETLIWEKKGVIQYAPLPVIKASAMEIRLLFQNLVSNALKYISPGTVPLVQISCESDGDFIKFAVKDNGIGIEKEYQGRIFDMFQRLHGWHEYEGTGIGLAHCKKIVEQHGGKIWVESEPRKGSTFYFTIKKNL